MSHAQYSTQSTREVAAFLDSVNPQLDAGAGGAAILDSIKNQSGVKVPKALDILLGKLNTNDEGRILDSVGAGLSHFQAEHGRLPTADVVEAAIQQGSTALYGVDRHGNILDSASSSHSDPISLQPNRAVVAILSAIAEAIPFASYLPVDIASNQAKLAILSHKAGTAYGDYALDEIMDGVNAGDVYASSARFVRFDHSGVAPYASKFTTQSLSASGSEGFCDPAGTGFPVLRGRTIVYVNGKVAATDVPNGSAANSPISGSVTIGANTHVITGFVTVATGAIELTTVSPDFAAGTEVTAQAFVDYETSPSLIPSVIVRADVYDIFANPWRVMTGMSIDASGQLRNELGLDGQSEALMAIRTQMSLERHYQALKMAYALGKNNEINYDFGYPTRSAQMTRAQMWQDFEANLSNADQKMANDTMDHGITHIYASAWMTAQIESLGSDMFVPSGIAKRPSIYRVGRLFGKYEVYYSPKVASQAADLTTASILAVGRSTQVARCPIVLGDAVAPTFLSLNMQSDLKASAAMYARDFTVVNPHEPSALGCARINFTNLK